MSKNVVWALILLVLTVLVIIVNRSSIPLNLLILSTKVCASFVYLGFVVVGVVIGALLK